MYLLLSMPGGIEMIGLLLLAIVFIKAGMWILRRILKNRELKRELDLANRERDELKNEII